MSLTGTRVLIVEDDEPLRGMLEQLFSIEGCVVSTASEGPQALSKLLEEDTPDLIVLDLMLPWVNGIEILGRIRQQSRLMSVPVLVTTGTATTPFDLRDFGPLRVIRKPFDTDAVIPAAEELVKNRANR
jgi:two-component system alkaline phosphatase synthesis response regulator PhoP